MRAQAPEPSEERVHLKGCLCGSGGLSTWGSEVWDQGSSGGKRGCDVEECVSGMSIQAERGGDTGQAVRAQAEEGAPHSGGLTWGNRMGGRAHVSGRGWQQPYGLDYKKGIDSISEHIRNDGCQVSHHQQEKL